MKQTINKSDFHDAFIKMGRENNFTHEAREALFDYLESDDEDETELDVIAFCCDFAEVSSGEIYDEDEVIAKLNNGNYLIHQS